MIKTRCPKGLRPEPSRDSPLKEGVAAWLFQFGEPNDGSPRAGHALGLCRLCPRWPTVDCRRGSALPIWPSALPEGPPLCAYRRHSSYPGVPTTSRRERVRGCRSAYAVSGGGRSRRLGGGRHVGAVLPAGASYGYVGRLTGSLEEMAPEQEIATIRVRSSVG